MSEEREIEIQDEDCGDMSLLVENAIGGDALAQSVLAAKLATGVCVEMDELGALYWYFQAIKAGYVHAKWNAGSMLIGDEGSSSIKHNKELGLRLIEEAAAAGENSACLFLSNCYEDALYGKRRDGTLALYWKKKAWDYQSAKEYDNPLDVCREYNLNIAPPVLRLK